MLCQADTSCGTHFIGTPEIGAVRSPFGQCHDKYIHYKQDKNSPEPLSVQWHSAAIESADVVIQTDQPSKVATAISIGRATRRIVMQNIVGAITVKVLVLLAGACGFATLWAAVFADVGVALLVVLNSVRILRKKF